MEIIAAIILSLLVLEQIIYFINIKRNKMSREVDFTIDLYLDRDYDKNEYQVRDEILDVEEAINNLRGELKMYSSTSLNEIIPTEWNENPISWLSMTINEVLENYEDRLQELFKLRLYLEYLTEQKE